MASATPVSPVPRAKRNRELILILVMCSISLGAAVLWLVTAARAWQATQVERLLTREKPVATETLVSVLEKSWRLTGTRLSGRHLHVPVLLASSLYSNQVRSGFTDSDIADRGVMAARLALVREPANSRTWARLAFFQHLQEGPSAAVVAALRLSIYTAPAKSELLFWRLSLLARNRAFWNLQTADLVRSQILLAWRVNPRELAEVVQAHDLEIIARVVLAARPEQLHLLDTLLQARQTSP